MPKYFNGSFLLILSKNGFSNLKKIIKTKEFKKLNGVVIGRSDLAGSFNLSKSIVNSNKIYNVAIQSKKTNLRIN